MVNYRQESPKTYHVVLTPYMLETMPKKIKITEDFGDLTVIFKDGIQRTGKHCFIECWPDSLKKWFSKQKEMIIGSGIPAQEQFTMHIMNPANQTK